MPDTTPGHAGSTLLDPRPAARPPLLQRVLAVVMVVVEPLLLGLAASGAMSRLPLYGVPAWLFLAARGSVAAFGIVVGRRLWAGDGGARRAALVWVVLSCGLAWLTIATPYFPGNRTPGDKRMAVVTTAAWYGLWALYLLRAGAVRRVPRDTRS